MAAGLGLLTRRLPGSETHGRDLKAQVWAEYDIPAPKQARRVSIGFDGYRRGASLSGLDWAVYTVDHVAAARGVVDVRARARRSEPGASIAMVVGVAGLRGRTPVEPALASLRQAPVPGMFSAHARFDTRALDGELSMDTSRVTTMDAVVLAARSYGKQVAHIVAARLGGQATAELTRSRRDGPVDLRFTSTTPLARAELYTYAYSGDRLSKAAGGTITDLPAGIRARYEPGASSRLIVDTDGPRPSGRNTGVNVIYFDRAAARTVLQASLAGLPAHLTIFHNTRKNRLACTASSTIGRVEAVLQRGEGAISSPSGAHVTMIKNGSRLGVSGRLSGLSGFDVAYGRRPHAVLKLDSPGGPFMGAASIDGTHLARMEISDTPDEVEVNVDPVAKKAAYRASGTIDRIRAAYSDTRTGPTIDGTVYGVRSAVEASWTMGSRTVADVTAASGLKKVTLYLNRRHVTTVGPHCRDDLCRDDLSATAEGVRAHIRMVADGWARRRRSTAFPPPPPLPAPGSAAVSRSPTAAAPGDPPDAPGTGDRSVRRAAAASASGAW
ncbi:hypothetical protein N5079_19190 [Planotetraspora sp. A-T 1434]|uniref:hypothetical protein n=1 Tax=Planotetraspora sp. A-T 1434 TaxID=2979219 RepID=UPI0021C1EA20|nr:hypothetical protein [Planotetraspora sp. A-T 1434]MCT9932331.1 hypothetical protein [Planotetraspora sp. A-T 1434]